MITKKLSKIIGRYAAYKKMIQLLETEKRYSEENKEKIQFLFCKSKLPADVCTIN